MNSQELEQFMGEIDACLAKAKAEFELGPEVAPIKHGQEMAKVREGLSFAKNACHDAIGVCKTEETRVVQVAEAEAIAQADAVKAEEAAKVKADQEASEAQVAQGPAPEQTNETVNP